MNFVAHWKGIGIRIQYFLSSFWYRILYHFYLFLWFFSTRFGMNTYLSDTLKVRTWYYTCSMMDQIWCQSYKNSGNAWLDSETHSFTSFCLFFAIGRILNWVELCFSHFIIQFLKKMVDFLFLFLVFVNLFFVRFEMLFHKEKKNRVLVFPLGQVFSQKCSSSVLFFRNQIEFLRDMKIFFFIIIF